MTGIRTG